MTTTTSGNVTVKSVELESEMQQNLPSFDNVSHIFRLLCQSTRPQDFVAQKKIEDYDNILARSLFEHFLIIIGYTPPEETDRHLFGQKDLEDMDSSSTKMFSKNNKLTAGTAASSLVDKKKKAATKRSSNYTYHETKTEDISDGEFEVDNKAKTEDISEDELEDNDQCGETNSFTVTSRSSSTKRLSNHIQTEDISDDDDDGAEAEEYEQHPLNSKAIHSRSQKLALAHSNTSLEKNNANFNNLRATASEHDEVKIMSATAAGKLKNLAVSQLKSMATKQEEEQGSPIVQRKKHKSASRILRETVRAIEYHARKDIEAVRLSLTEKEGYSIPNVCDPLSPKNNLSFQHLTENWSNPNVSNKWEESSSKVFHEYHLSNRDS